MLTNIETERVRKGLTQEQLASQLGVSHKTYYNWINEKKDIPSQKLKKMSRMFKTNMEYLLGEEQKPCTLAGLRPEKVSEIVVVHIISVTYRHL